MTNSYTYTTWFDKGMALQDEEKYAEALDCFQKAVKLKPDFIPAWVYQGITLEQLQRYEEAIACYNEAIKINPNVADLWYNKGATLCNLRRYQEAVQCFDKVLEIEPNNAICQTTRVLTIGALTHTVIMPKQTDTTEERPPISAEAEVEITLYKKREGQFFDQQSREIDGTPGL
ncbi:MAG: tetratricopeptide repeat protein [Microcoleus vaginatus WJT46-NPBG5]|jgi:tetratricopeptide (TPR) repeat protein|nr:tetratricopeptide repeat protein [Microcoleus vaginatus WJT46-NPBG5]